MSTHVYFDQRVTALQQELRNHPELLEKMKQARENAETAQRRVFEDPTFNPAEVDTIKDGAEELGFIAAYLGIYLDGEYLIEDLYRLCWELRKRLIERRKVYVNPDLPALEPEKVILTPADLIKEKNGGVEPAFKFDETEE